MKIKSLVSCLLSPLFAIIFGLPWSSEGLQPLSRHYRLLRASRDHRTSKKFTSINDISEETIQAFVPPEVGPEIYAGSIVAILPIVYATILFSQRVQTQRQCLICNGSGLIWTTSQGSKLKKPRKCNNCGGMLPWLGWKYFFFSSIFEIGNGGVLRFPSPNYEEANKKEMERRALDGGKHHLTKRSI